MPARRSDSVQWLWTVPFVLPEGRRRSDPQLPDETAPADTADRSARQLETASRPRRIDGSALAELLTRHERSRSAEPNSPRLALLSRLLRSCLVHSAHAPKYDAVRHLWVKVSRPVSTLRGQHLPDWPLKEPVPD